jgi:hypothetical protein
MAPKKEGRKDFRLVYRTMPMTVRTTIKKNCLTFSGSKVFIQLFRASYKDYSLGACMESMKVYYFTGRLLYRISIL